jgi:hypothetical protein
MEDPVHHGVRSCSASRLEVSPVSFGGSLSHFRLATRQFWRNVRWLFGRSYLVHTGNLLVGVGKDWEETQYDRTTRNDVLLRHRSGSYSSVCTFRG